MRYFYGFLGFILFTLALGFAMKNAHPVTLHYYLGFGWQAPLVLVLLVSICVGALAGILACLPLVIRQRRRLLALQHELNTVDNNR